MSGDHYEEIGPMRRTQQARGGPDPFQPPDYLMLPQSPAGPAHEDNHYEAIANFNDPQYFSPPDVLAPKREEAATPTKAGQKWTESTRDVTLTDTERTVRQESAKKRKTRRKIPLWTYLTVTMLMLVINVVCTMLFVRGVRSGCSAQETMSKGHLKRLKVLRKINELRRSKTVEDDKENSFSQSRTKRQIERKKETDVKKSKKSANNCKAAKKAEYIEMGETGGHGGVERCKSKRVIKAIVYGNTAVHLGKKLDNDHTHEWTVFVRPYHNEDPSKFIRKVQFRLHDSYANPTRVVEKPPFEVTETGWGEFEVQIRIYFIDVSEKPITAFHYLRLFQPQATLPNGKTIVAAEYYDEIVFQEPTVTMYKALVGSEGRKCDPKRFYTDFVHVRKRTLEMITNARTEIGKEIDDLRESLKDAHKLIQKYRAEVENLESAAASTPAPVSFSVGDGKPE
ncbi:unnamed protein product [Anisakis simplex]|uniref:YEATS domain-containing protein 4 n=1 Tax=Anisakis simplex TaxID=6269 RepID=A0A0M3K122_ANISI|nr:unnamed protein product [Anisakis simplex]